MTRKDDIHVSRMEFAKTLAGISSTLAALCLAILVFSLEREDMPPEFSQWLWGAVILFAVASFRCLDVLMDEISDSIGENYKVWPKNWKWVILDKRVVDFELAVLLLFVAWVFFSIAMYAIGSYIHVSFPWKGCGVALMIGAAVLFVTRKPDILELKVDDQNEVN